MDRVLQDRRKLLVALTGGAALLLAAGFGHAFNLASGIEGWAEKAGMPVEHGAPVDARSGSSRKA